MEDCNSEMEDCNSENCLSISENCLFWIFNASCIVCWNALFVFQSSPITWISHWNSCLKLVNLTGSCSTGGSTVCSFEPSWHVLEIVVLQMMKCCHWLGLVCCFWFWSVGGTWGSTQKTFQKEAVKTEYNSDNDTILLEDQKFKYVYQLSLMHCSL